MSKSESKLLKMAFKELQRIMELLDLGSPDEIRKMNLISMIRSIEDHLFLKIDKKVKTCDLEEGNVFIVGGECYVVLRVEEDRVSYSRLGETRGYSFSLLDRGYDIKVTRLRRVQ